jgi:hypothetical protein
MDNDFGIYVDVEPTEERDQYYHRLYKARCSVCNTIVYKKLSVLRSKNKRCRHAVEQIEIQDDRIKRIFIKMKQRCFNPSDKNYRHYGGKGVSICDAWLSHPILFEEWSLNNGYTEQMTIDRLDSNGNYCPENCQWVTATDNARYKSTTRLIEVNKELRTGREWSLICGLGINTINSYLRSYPRDTVVKFIEACLADGLPQTKHKQSYIAAFLEKKTPQGLAHLAE